MNAYQGRKTAHAEDLACRLIAYQKSLDAKQLQRPDASSEATESKRECDQRSHSKVCPTTTTHNDLHDATVSDFSSSPASVIKEPVDLDVNSCAPELSCSQDFSKASLDVTDDMTRNVRVTHFNDEPEEWIESSESLPSHCDKKGRCINHSNIRLYKKHLLGDFTLLMSKCPLCQAVDQELSCTTKPRIVIKRSISNGRGRSREDNLENASNSNQGGKSFQHIHSTSLVRSASSELIRSLSLDQAPPASRNNLISRVKPKVLKKVIPETDQHIRGILKTRPDTSPRSDVSKCDTCATSIDNNQASFSKLGKGIEKLNLLNPRGRSSSRKRGTSDASTIKSGGDKSVFLETTQKSKLNEKSKSKRKFDSTGRCKKHPSVILARKRPFSKGWDIIKTCCPMCADVDQKNATTKTKPLSSQDRSPSPDDYNASFYSSNTPPSETNTPMTTRNLSRSRPNRSHPSKSPQRDKISSQVPRVQKMPYTTPWGESGWYTGEVNEERQPNGRGRMRMKTENVVSGLWNKGYSEEYLEKHSRMKSGFGTNVAAWKKSAASPHFETPTLPSMPPQTRANLQETSTRTSLMVQPLPQYAGQLYHHSQHQYPSPLSSTQRYPHPHPDVLMHS